MRARALLAAFLFVMTPAVTAASVAFADGIERPHHRPRPRPHRRPTPVVPAPAPVIEVGPEEVHLDNSFFASAGGVGVDIGTGYVGGGTTVIVGGSSASAFAFASARASAGGRGFGGHHGGGHGGGGCGCH